MAVRSWYYRSVILLLLLMVCAPLAAQTGEQVLLVVNRKDAVSSQIAGYYRSRRSIPLQNVCYLETTSEEEIHWDLYVREIETPVGECLKKQQLTEKVLYIVLTMGIPLKVDGGGSGVASEHASVDSELTLLYQKLRGKQFSRAGQVANPFFGQRLAPFRHPQFPIYLVTRLAAYDLNDVKGMIDRSLAARNTGRFVLDSVEANGDGDNWMHTAAMLLPASRVLLDTSPKVLYGLTDVIGYASWGSNDVNRKKRMLGFQWLPGAVAMEYVSTSARTMKRPPDNWNLTSWKDTMHYFAGSPQGLSADLIHDGATAATGNVYEPYLIACARPDYLIPAYFDGRNVAESYYLSIPFLSWQGVLLADPLCSLGKP
jgi:uncharacterized protein (TIGR03790 family)